MPYYIGISDYSNNYNDIFNTIEIHYTYNKKLSNNQWIKLRDLAMKKIKYSIIVNKEITTNIDINTMKYKFNDFWNGCKIIQNNISNLLFIFDKDYQLNIKNMEKIIEFNKYLPIDINHCIQFNNNEWYNTDIINFLEKNNWIIIINNNMNIYTPNLKYYKPLNNTIYIRYNGSIGNHIGSYDKKILLEIKKFIKTQKIKKVFIYFNNDQSETSNLNINDAIFDGIRMMNITKNKKLGKNIKL